MCYILQEEILCEDCGTYLRTERLGGVKICDGWLLHHQCEEGPPFNPSNPVVETHRERDGLCHGCAERRQRQAGGRRRR